jgi:hypothetical protein
MEYTNFINGIIAKIFSTFTHDISISQEIQMRKKFTVSIFLEHSSQYPPHKLYDFLPRRWQFEWSLALTNSARAKPAVRPL